MRSTLTIDPDVAQLLAQTVARVKKPFKQVVNEALRRGLSAPEIVPSAPFKVTPYALGWNAALDPAGFNQLADDFAVDDYIELQRRLSSIERSKQS